MPCQYASHYGVELMPDTELLNTAEAVSRMGGDEEIYKAVLQTFTETYGPDFPLKMQAAAMDGNLFGNERIGQEAHKIKGASYTIGANRLGDAAAALEKAARSPSCPALPENSLEAAENLLKTFKTAYENTIEAIGKHMG